MSLDLKRSLIAQLVESSRLLRNYIDNRAKGRGTTRAQWIVLFRLRQQEGLSQVDLADVLELTTATYAERFRGSAMKRAKLAGLQRNARTLLETHSQAKITFIEVH